MAALGVEMTLAAAVAMVILCCSCVYPPRFPGLVQLWPGKRRGHSNQQGGRTENGVRCFDVSVSSEPICMVSYLFCFSSSVQISCSFSLRGHNNLILRWHLPRTGAEDILNCSMYAGTSSCALFTAGSYRPTKAVHNRSGLHMQLQACMYDYDTAFLAILTPQLQMSII